MMPRLRGCDVAAALARLTRTVGVLSGTLLTFAALGAANGCTIAAHTELTAHDCSDRDANDAAIDNDNDHKANCNDPDCWVYSFCGHMPSIAGQGGTSGTSSTDADASTPRDAGHDANITMPMPDSSMDVPDATPLPPTCGDAGIVCKSSEVCQAGICKVPTDLIDFDLRIASASVPIWDTGTICFDQGCSVSPAFLCDNCKPDPQVVTEVDGKQVNKTMPVNDVLAASWNEPVFRISVNPDKSTIVFTVLDGPPELPTEPDPKIYSCTPDLSVMKTATTGVLKCSPSKDQVAPPPGGASDYYSVTAEFTKLDGAN